jgi:DNA-binding SARP family transcriptional activator
MIASRASAAKPFVLTLLGPFELLDGGANAPIAITVRKARALLAYLAMAPRYSAGRATLAALLWGDTNDDQARQSLRQALSGLRRIQSAGQPLVIADDDSVRLHGDVVDIDALGLLRVPEDADLAALQRACAGYRGPFGSELDVGEPPFDDWLQAERQRIADRAIALHDRLIAALIAQNRHQEALIQANALLAINPLREETHRTIIAQEAIVSGRAAAMQRFETFRRLLRDELAVRPEAATARRASMSVL